jgi:electron transport complex protein RnfE
LAPSVTLTTGLALGSASLAVICVSNVLAAVLVRRIAPRLRLAAVLLLISALVTAVDLAFQASAFDARTQAGQFVPLIAANCWIFARAEHCAGHAGASRALLDGLRDGAGFIILLGILGGTRELLAPGLQIAVLPTGVLLLLGAAVALRQQWLDRPGTR